MSDEFFDGAAIAQGAMFVAGAGGELYYWVGSREWRPIPPDRRVWFPTEAAAQAAGYQRCASACLDEFEMLGELGRGGTSIVYHARDRALGREVAIKVIQASFDTESDTVARFAQEARLLAKLRHPNIVSAFSVKQLEGGGLALVMEYVPGRTLREIVRDEGPLPAERAERILRELGGALAAAHQHDIVHRDVKPDNIFLEEASDAALLADFGIAMHLDRPSGLTMVGAAVGTPNYMSPEQIDGERIDGRSDLYSLAMIGWEMLTGEQPWAGENLYSVIYKQKKEELPLLHRQREDVPARLLFAIEGALAKDPEARWSSVDEFLFQLSDESATALWRSWSGAVMGERRTSAPMTEASARIAAAARAEMKTVVFRRSETEPRPAPTVSDGSRPAVLPGAPHARSAPNPELPPVSAPGSPSGAGHDPGGDSQPIFDSDRAASPLPAPLPDAIEDAHPAFPPDAVVAPSQRVAATRGPARWRRLLATAFVINVGLPTVDASVRQARTTPELERTGAEVEVAAGDRAALPGRPNPASGGARDRAFPPHTPQPAELGVGGAPSETSGVPNLVLPGLDELPPGTDTADAADAADDLADDVADAAESSDPPDTSDATTAELDAGDNDVPPAPALPIAREQSRIAAGRAHTCELDPSGSLLCWGANDRGQLGNERGGSATPVPVDVVPGFEAVVAGEFHTCALSVTGIALCWGANENGQLGAGDGDRTGLVQIERSRFYSISLGAAHTCGVGLDARAYCWGANTNGQIGDGSGDARATPSAVSLPDAPASMAAGAAHTCALTRAGDAYCWGQNNRGQLGSGGTSDQLEPVQVAAELRFRSVTAGTAHTCGLTPDGEAFCWGENSDGRLGDGTTTNRSVPSPVASGLRFAELSAGDSHTCGVAFDGSGYCWGQNAAGQLGTGDADPRTRPARVQVSVPLAAIRAGGSHTCGLTGQGTSYCWGMNGEGQLGDGSRDRRSTPGQVAF